MNTEQSLLDRSDSKCELCASESKLSVYEVPPETDINTDRRVLVCEVCLDQLNNPKDMNANHWRCLNDSMWNPEPAVQVMVWRQLNHLNNEAWAQALLDMLYLEPEVQQWAEATELAANEHSAPSKDSNGTILLSGDSVTLIKDLDVKGANFTAKRGTTVKNISLTDQPEHIEGRINGTRIVLLTKFLKKAS